MQQVAWEALILVVVMDTLQSPLAPQTCWMVLQLGFSGTSEWVDWVAAAAAWERRWALSWQSTCNSRVTGGTKRACFPCVRACFPILESTAETP